MWRKSRLLYFYECNYGVCVFHPFLLYYFMFVVSPFSPLLRYQRLPQMLKASSPALEPTVCKDPAVCIHRHPEALAEDWNTILSSVGRFNESSRSPCWWQTHTLGHDRYAEQPQPQPHGEQQQQQQRQQQRSNQCLPGLMLLGVSKSGTTDFFDRLSLHPKIFPSGHKEPHFWTRNARSVEYTP